MDKNADKSIVKRFKKTDEVLAKYGLHLKKSKLTRKILNEPNSVRKNHFFLFFRHKEVERSVKKNAKRSFVTKNLEFRFFTRIFASRF
jgi:hypothetical protein